MRRTSGISDMRGTRARGRAAQLVGALVALAMLLAGCASTQSTVAPSLVSPTQIFRGAVVTGGAPSEPTLDPAQAMNAGSREIVNLVYDGLVTLDHNMAVEMWGASSVDISSDGLTYTFHIRPGQLFSDGSPVHASDYAYGINRTLNPCVASPGAYYLFAIKDAQTFAGESCAHGTITAAPGQPQQLVTTLIGDSLTANDPTNTLVVTLAHASAYFLTALTYPFADALEASVVGTDPTSEAWQSHLSDGATGHGGSGMYYVSKLDRGGGHISLKANPHWWGLAQGKRPTLTEIDWSIFPDATSAYYAYTAGQVDVASPPASQLATGNSLVGLHRTPLLSFSALEMNWKTLPFDSVDARLAFCLAINRDALAQALYPGGAAQTEMPTWHAIVQGMPGYDTDLIGPDGISSTKGDATKAQAHWKAYVQSLHGAPPPLVSFYSLSSSAAQTSLGTALRQQWQSVLGVTVAARAVGGGNGETNPPTLAGTALHPLNWTADYPDGQAVLTQLLQTGAPFNDALVSVPDADTLLQNAESNPDQSVRAQEYQQAEQILLDQGALCPLFQDVSVYQLATYVHGWSEGADGGVPSNDVWLQTVIMRH